VVVSHAKEWRTRKDLVLRTVSAPESPPAVHFSYCESSVWFYPPFEDVVSLSASTFGRQSWSSAFNRQTCAPLRFIGRNKTVWGRGAESNLCPHENFMLQKHSPCRNDTARNFCPPEEELWFVFGLSSDFVFMKLVWMTVYHWGSSAIYEGRYESNASYFFFSETIITIIMKLTYHVYILYKVEIIFPQSLLHY
jgi:hypothetical protein